MLRCQVLCSPGGLCPALIACVCAHSSGRAEQRGFPGCAVLGKAVSIRDSLLLTERGRAPAVCKASAPRSPPRSRVCCAGTVGLRGAPLRGTTHSITVRCSHCVPLIPAQSPPGLPGAIGSQQRSGRARSDRCWGRGDSREWGNDSPRQPCNYSPDGARVCETRAPWGAKHPSASTGVCARPAPAGLDVGNQ